MSNKLRLISDGVAVGTRLLDADGHNLAAKASRIVVTVEPNELVVVNVTYVNVDIDMAAYMPDPDVKP